MQFDLLTLILLVRNPDAPTIDDEAAAAVQDAHLAHLAQLHAAGHLVAAGPALGADDREVRGVCLFTVDPQRAMQLEQDDPAVRAGRFTVTVLPWMVPAGAIVMTATRLPRSAAEARQD